MTCGFFVTYENFSEILYFTMVLFDQLFVENKDILQSFYPNKKYIFNFVSVATCTLYRNTIKILIILGGGRCGHLNI